MDQNFKGIVPYLFHDDAEAALDFYQRVFGFEEISRWNNEEGSLQNAEMRVGPTEIWIDGGGSRQDDDERPQWIGVWVDNVESMYQRVLAAGVECEPPVDRDFGVRMLTISDGMGYLWGFMRRLEI